MEMESRGTYLETYLNIYTATNARFVKRLAKVLAYVR